MILNKNTYLKVILLFGLTTILLIGLQKLYASEIYQDGLTNKINNVMSLFDQYMLDSTNNTIEERSCVYELHRRAALSVSHFEKIVRAQESRRYINIELENRSRVAIEKIKIKTLDTVVDSYYRSKACKDLSN